MAGSTEQRDNKRALTLAIMSDMNFWPPNPGSTAQQGLSEDEQWQAALLHAPVITKMLSILSAYLVIVSIAEHKNRHEQVRNNAKSGSAYKSWA
jgi:hypothetical protein